MMSNDDKDDNNGNNNDHTDDNDDDTYTRIHPPENKKPPWQAMLQIESVWPTNTRVHAWKGQDEGDGIQASVRV